MYLRYFLNLSFLLFLKIKATFTLSQAPDPFAFPHESSKAAHIDQGSNITFASLSVPCLVTGRPELIQNSEEGTSSASHSTLFVFVIQECHSKERQQGQEESLSSPSSVTIDYTLAFPGLTPTFLLDFTKRTLVCSSWVSQVSGPVSFTFPV